MRRLFGSSSRSDKQAAAAAEDNTTTTADATTTTTNNHSLGSSSSSHGAPPAPPFRGFSSGSNTSNLDGSSSAAGMYVFQYSLFSCVEMVLGGKRVLTLFVLWSESIHFLFSYGCCSVFRCVLIIFVRSFVRFPIGFSQERCGSIVGVVVSSGLSIVVGVGHVSRLGQLSAAGGRNQQQHYGWWEHQQQCGHEYEQQPSYAK